MVTLPFLLWVLQMTSCAAETSCSSAASPAGEVRWSEVSEEDVGIAAFTTTTRAIDCVFRERYSDFVVHEIGLDESVVTLSDESVPPEDENEATGESVESTIAALVATTSCAEESAAAALSASLRALTQDASLPPVVMPATDDKCVRKRQHELVATGLSQLASDTLVDGESKSVRIFGSYKQCNNGNKRQKRLDVRSRWPRGKPKVVRMAVYKENTDTMTVANQLGRALRCGRVGYAGTKDRRAVTTQWLTVSNVLPSKIVERTRSMRQWCRVGNFSFVESHLELGDLAGNRFEIALRRVSEELDESAVQEACQAVSTFGFCNYFGLQRFGSAASNSTVGLKALAGDWKACIDLILARKPFDDAPTTRAKNAYFEQNDMSLAKAAMPRHQRTELAVLDILEKHPNDACGAFHKGVAKNLRLMYLHAHQSLVWNTLATARVKLGSRSVVEGDLVIPRATGADKLSADAQVVVVTPQNVDEFSVFDVVLPMPGIAVVDPAFEGAQAAMLAGGKLETERYRNVQRPEYTLRGAYRRLFVKPGNLTWRLAKYQDKLQQLIETDVDRISASSNSSSISDEKIGAPTAKDKGDEQQSQQQHNTALVVSFDLPPSSYATCCLREITKCSMAKGHHASITKDGSST